MEFEVTVKYRYKANPDTVLESYGTTDPAEMAAIDQKGFSEDPTVIVDDLSVYAAEITVVPVKEG